MVGLKLAKCLIDDNKKQKGNQILKILIADGYDNSQIKYLEGVVLLDSNKQKAYQMFQ